MQKRITALLLSLSLLMVVGCYESKVEFAGNVAPFQFNGLKITLPVTGKGKYGASPTRFDFRWPESNVIVIDQLPNGTFEIRKDGVLLGTAEEGDHIRFNDDGQLATEADP